MKQLITTPTRVTAHSRSIIDLFFTTLSPALIKASGVIDNIITDHFPIFISKKKKREHHPQKHIRVRIKSLYNKDYFKNVLLDDNRWREFWLGNYAPDALWALMLTIINDNLNLLCPWKTIKIRDDQPDWFDGEVRKKIKDKNVHHMLAQQTKLSEDWNTFKALKNEVRALIIKKKRGYITNKLAENRKAPKKFWKTIQKNLNFGKEAASANSVIIHCDNEPPVTGEVAANKLNNYYAGVGAELAEKFSNVWHFPLNIPDYSIPVMNFRFVGEKEVTALIKFLNENKSSRVDNVNMFFLKEALLCLVTEFTFLLNKCLELSVMPNSWSIGAITPVPKTGFSKKMPDFRPISVLPAPSKIIERAVYNQLIYHLESHGLLYPQQHGFRKDHSTCSAILELVQYIYNAFDNREFTSCVFIDYSKAFDTIDHDILCKKLQYYGLDRNVINWCKDNLSNRQQYVKIGDHISGYTTVKYGVPQGSILGPLFFIIYVNDILSLFNSDVKMLLYADDTVLYYSHTDPVYACKMVETSLKLVCDWCNMNKLTINTGKTKHILCKPRNSPLRNIQSSVKMNELPLETVTFYNYLGVIIDENLTFESFVKEKCNKVNLRVYQLGKMRKFISSHIATTIYKQAIIPLFDYADFLVEGGTRYYQEKLDCLHEKALSIIDCKKHKNLEVCDLQILYGLNSIGQRRKEHHCAIMYRLSRRKDNLDQYRPKINLRSRKRVKFRLPLRNLTKISKSPLLRGIKLWDMVPEPIQRSLTKVKFKREIKSIRL